MHTHKSLAGRVTIDNRYAKLLFVATLSDPFHRLGNNALQFHTYILTTYEKRKLKASCSKLAPKQPNTADPNEQICTPGFRLAGLLPKGPERFSGMHNIQKNLHQTVCIACVARACVHCCKHKDRADSSVNTFIPMTCQQHCHCVSGGWSG